MADIKVQVDAGKVSMDFAELAAGDCIAGANGNLWEKLDYSAIKTDGIDPALVQPTWVGGLTYYSTVLAWNTQKYGDNAPKTWADFWDVKKFPGKRAMYNNPYTMIEIALMADGVAPDKLYPPDLDRAFKKLRELKPNVVTWWTSGAQSAQLLKDGEADMSPMWNGRVSTIVKVGAKVDFTYNQGLLGVDCMVVPRGAKNKELAMRVLNRLLAPDIQANIPRLIDYGPVNAKAFATGKIPQQDAAKINSSPENARLQVTLDDVWWGTNRARVQERWDSFIQE
jgi:putative spermidine/putrescine transport system substrate-binding protein